ncbi:MAG: iron-containing alcohol dehydrogenase [Oscillospiraceae bacterium]|nr:iron-containing alcohol dehydrogenase [Oscillospiraceae bacterium]
MSSTYTQVAPVLFGCGAVAELGDKVKEQGGSKALCVYDSGVAASGISDKVIGILKKAGIEAVPFDKIAPEAPNTEIDKNAEFVRSCGADCVVGIGGGTAMDTAKLYSILLKNPPPIDQYYASKIGPGPKIAHAPLILIPTCSGTGSEATGIGVVHDMKINKKEAIFCFANQAILDPELTITSPPKVTAFTGMDALCHAVEAYTSVGASPKSDLLALDAMRRISANIERAFKNGNDIEARTELSIASNFAGSAFWDASVHFGHAIAHTFGLEFNVPHGIACALVMPEVVVFSEEALPGRIADIHKALGAPKGVSTADFIREMMRKVEIPSMASLGHSREQVLALAEACMFDWFVIMSPFKVDAGVMAKVLAAVYDNYK